MKIINDEEKKFKPFQIEIETEAEFFSLFCFFGAMSFVEFKEKVEQSDHYNKYKDKMKERNIPATMYNLLDTQRIGQGL